MFGAGWLLLLVAVAAAFISQARIAAAVDRAKNAVDDRDGEWSTAPGLIALCLTVFGLAPARAGDSPVALEPFQNLFT